MRCAVPFLALTLAMPLALAPADLAGRQAREATLGTVSFPTSCEQTVQPSFDRAVALLHHMTYAQAREGFESIVRTDPACAMAHWGIAMTLFQPLWPTRPTANDLARGWSEAQQARKLGGTERERLFVAAVAAFFDPAMPDYGARIRAWAAATETLAERVPQDLEVRAFLGLARLAAAGSAGDASVNAAIAALLGDILRVSPTHPGAIHYTIHANDATGREGESLDVVRRYAQVAPRNPHALHMPTHIQVRLGDWKDVIEGNVAAAAAALEHPAGERGQWVWDEFPHAIEYLVYAELQRGDDDEARREMKRLMDTADLEPTFKTAFHLASVPARYALERHDWAGAVALEPRPSTALDWSRYPWPEAITWFAKGLGAARMKDMAAAEEAVARMTELRDASERLGEAPFARQTELLRRIVQGWLYWLGDNPQMAVDTLRAAAAFEATLPKPPVTPAPTLPAEEVLGDLLLEVGLPADALAAYRRCLETAPGRFNSLVGAARAARALGDDAAARDYYRALLDQVVTDSPRPEVAEARAFLRH